MRHGANRLVMAVLGAIVLLTWSPDHAAAADDDAEPDAGADGKFVKQGPQLGGYIQVHFNRPVGGSEGRFRVQRARLTVEGRPYKKLRYEMDIDPRSPDHAGTLRDAFFDYEFLKGATLRIGQHKTKFGYINNVSSSRLYVVNRPEVADALSRGINLRDIGASLIVKRNIGSSHRAEYWLSVVNGAGLNVQRDNNEAKNVFGRVGFANRGKGFRWRWGISGAVGDAFESSSKPEFAEKGGYYLDFKRVGTDLQLHNDRFEFITEFLVGDHKEKGESETMHGYYATLIGKTSGRWGPVLSYDSINDTEDVRVTLGGYYGKPNDDFRFLLNYEFRGAVDTGRLYLWTLVRF